MTWALFNYLVRRVNCRARLAAQALCTETTTDAHARRNPPHVAAIWHLINRRVSDTNLME